MKTLKENLLETINPKRGQGMSETIMFIVLVVAITFLAYEKIEVPALFLISLGSILGYITGNSKGGKDDE